MTEADGSGEGDSTAVEKEPIHTVSGAAGSRFSVKRILLIVGVVNTTGFLPPAAEGTRATSFEG